MADAESHVLAAVANAAFAKAHGYESRYVHLLDNKTVR